MCTSGFTLVHKVCRQAISKAPEDWRTPRPSEIRAPRPSRSVLECGSPLPLFPRSKSRKIVHDAPSAIGLERLLHKFDMRGMRLIIVLRFLVRKNNVQRDLIRLLDHRPRARNHSANVKVQDAWNWLQPF